MAAQRKEAGDRAKNKEQAWLVARLVELLQGVLPKPPTLPNSKPTTGRRPRKR